METGSARRSAKILPFPTAARRSAAILSNKARFAAELASLGALPSVEFGSGWYHERAVEDAARERKN
jgi:hypothetical protein